VSDPTSPTQILQELTIVESEERVAVEALEAAEAASKAAEAAARAAAAAAAAANTTAAQAIAGQYKDRPLEEWFSFCSDVGPQQLKKTEHKQMHDGTHDELNFLEMFTNDQSLENIIKNIISRGKTGNGTQLSVSLQDLIKLEFDFGQVCSKCNKVFWDPNVDPNDKFDSFIERSITVEKGQIKFKCSEHGCGGILEYSLDHILKPWESGDSDYEKAPMNNSYNFIQYFINLLVSTFERYFDPL
jgi:hypothetical protein